MVNRFFLRYWGNVSINMEVLCRGTERELYFVHSDHLNTPQMLTDQNGNVVWQVQSQTPFGVVETNEDVDGDGQAIEFNLRFPGQYYDGETGLSYNYFRDYDPLLGRYVQSDPIGLEGGINTYGYTYQNPILFSDFFGLDVEVCLYPDSAHGFGHVGFGFPGQSDTAGFYPDGKNPLDTDGKIKPDEGKKECKTLDSDTDEDWCMLRCGLDRWGNPGKYKLFSRQCTSFVRDCLSQCRIFTGDYTGPRPKLFFEELEQNDH